MFEPASKFTILATRKYQLDRQAVGSLMCEKVRQLIAQEYADFSDVWQPTKFRDGQLTIKALGSSGGELFMRTQELLLKFKSCQLPASVQQIKIVKA